MTIVLEYIVKIGKGVGLSFSLLAIKCLTYDYLKIHETLPVQYPLLLMDYVQHFFCLRQMTKCMLEYTETFEK